MNREPSKKVIEVAGAGLPDARVSMGDAVPGGDLPEWGRSVSESEHSSTVAVEDVKAVHRQFVTGVTIVTVMDGDTPRGLAVNAFMSLSIDPPQVLVAIQRTSGTYPHLFTNDHVAVNIVSADQGEILGRFASKAPDKFAGVDWSAGENGAPLIAGSSGQLELTIRERIQASTHTIFIGLVTAARSFEIPPMVYAHGTFASAALLQGGRDGTASRG